MQRRRSGGAVRMAIDLWVLSVVLIACDPGTEIHYIEFRAASDPRIGRAFLLPDMQNTGGSSLALGPIAGNMGEVRYDLDVQQRAFLFPRSLTDFVFAGEYLHLPRMESATPSPFVVGIVPDDTPKWQSFRVYDAGSCSQLQPWQGIAEGLVDGIVSGFVTNSTVTNGRRINAATLLPIMHALGADGRILDVGCGSHPEHRVMLSRSDGREAC